MSLDLIIGPMFSGKTTELIRRLNTFKSIGQRCLYINSKIDDREDGNFSSHNKTINDVGVDSVKVQELSHINFNDYDVIGIDESQFFLFADLMSNVMTLVEDEGKYVIMSGLNGDFTRKKFGYILDFVPVCSDIVMLHPLCKVCGEKGIINNACFSKKLTTSKKVVEAGYNYSAVCRKCYLEFKS